MNDWALELDQLLRSQALRPHLQPIVDLRRGEVYGYEALIRGPQGSELEYPDRLFAVARSSGRLRELELCARHLAIEHFATLQLAGRLFLNVTTQALLSPDYPKGTTLELLAKVGMSPDQVVIELSEQQPYEDFAQTRQAVEHYRQMGFRIALDDLGSGYSGLRLWSEVAPDYVKVDKHFIHELDRNPVKREFVRSIMSIGQGVGSRLIAEGIETPEELRTLQDMGMSLGQGYLLGRPLPLPGLAVEPRWLKREGQQYRLGQTTETAASLVRTLEPLTPEQRTGEVVALFQQDASLSVLPVVQDGRPLGMVRRAALLESFSTQYGRALLENKPISRCMEPQPLCIDSQLPLDQVSQLVTEAAATELADAFIITHQDFYLGLGSVRDLLRRMTELQVQSARYANPLTQLPGSVPLNREMDTLLHSASPFWVAYFDLNHFKPFNDHYGYSRGDQVIQLLGELLRRHASNQDNLVGHIGGDDFIVIFQSPDWQQRCERILQEFDGQIASLYDPQDLQQGGIKGHNREGHTDFFPLLGLAIGVVQPDPSRCANHNDIAALAAQAKHKAKQQPGSFLYIAQPQRPPGYRLNCA